jgi:hypothetical protein
MATPDPDSAAVPKLQSQPGAAAVGAAPTASTAQDETNSVERPSEAELSAARDWIRPDLEAARRRRERELADAWRVLEATRTKPAAGRGATSSPSTSNLTTGVASSAAPSGLDERSPALARRVTPEIERDFVQVGAQWFHREDPQRLGFVDEGTVLSTPSSNPAEARVLVTLAEVREWGGIKIRRGTTEFRREVFIEASARGLPVVGYTPRDADLAEIQTRKAQYAKANIVEASAARAAAFRELSPEAALKRPDLAAATVAADALARVGDSVQDPTLRAQLQEGFRERLAQGMERGDVPRRLDDPAVGARARVYEGIYIEGERAPYKNDPDESENFVVRYRQADGTVAERWGKEIEKALKAAHVKPGDTIRLERVGAEPVTVVGNVRDAQARVIGKQELDTARNKWKVEVLERAPAPERSEPERTRER